MKPRSRLPMMLAVLASPALGLGLGPCLSTLASAEPPSRTTYREATSDSCSVCRVPCMKPWSIPDRWRDDGAPGYPEWAGNGRWDGEAFQDLNGDGVWSVGEPFTDGNGDHLYTSEYYHPLLTGYLATTDAGRPLVLKPGSPDRAPAPGQYYEVDLMPAPDDDPTGNRYEWNITHCWAPYVGAGNWLRAHPGNRPGPTVRGVTELLAQDPDARWDPETGTIQGSAFAVSPRQAILCLHDPRVGLDPGRGRVHVVKIAGLFIEGIGEGGDLIGRFIRLTSTGLPCEPGRFSPEAFVLTSCP